MISAEQTTESATISDAFRRVAALAVRLFDLPAAVVLRRYYDGWHPVSAYGRQAERLVAQLITYADVLETGNKFVVVPDLDNDSRFVSASPIPGVPSDGDGNGNGSGSRLRFLAAYINGADADGPAGCLCLLDVRPRQLRNEERELLGELAGLLSEQDGLAPSPANAPNRTADIIFMPNGRTADLAAVPSLASSPDTAALEARVAELTRLNDSLRAELGDRSEDALERVRFEQLIEESSDCVGLATLDGKIYYLNTAGRRLLGLDNMDEVRRTRIIDFLMREDRSFFLGTVVPNLMRHTHWEGDFRFRNFKTGASIEVSWNLFLLRDARSGEASGIALVTRDITERKKSEAALRESEERFRHLVEQAGEAFFVYDLDGRLIDVNKEACDSLGYPRSELLTLGVQDIEVGFDVIKGRERWKQMVPGVAVTTEGIHRRKDGSEFPAESRVAVFRSGSQRLLLALVRDITDRRRAEEALQQTQEQLEARVQERTLELGRAVDELRRSEVRIARMTANVPGMVYQLVLRNDGTADFPYVSEGCRELFGLEPAQMREDACTLLDIIHEEDIGEFLRSLDESRMTGAAWGWEGRYLTKGSEEVRWLQGVGRPERLETGETLWDGLFLNITTRKHAEEALRAAKEEAERANNAKSEFLSRMSHELRTPLNAILGFGQLLQMQSLAPAQNDRVGHIVTAGRHLLGLINEVLDIARIEAGRVELSLEPVRLSDTMVETLDLIRPLAAERGVTIHPLPEEHLPYTGYIMADRQRLKQVLLNLFSNAVKYNKEGGSVRLEYAPGEDNRLRIGVVDTGVGIAPDKLARLFTAFDRLGAEHSGVQGTGLGLALSKRLIEAMGGTVSVDSVHGEGTSFWLELPRAEGQTDAAQRQRQEMGELPAGIDSFHGGHTVLYIEDNLSNLTLIEHLLADYPGIKLITAMQGGLGLELARQHRPDLILLDLHLPDMPGWDVLARLQASEGTSGIPVVVVSADATPRQTEKLMKAGARAYLTKPLEVDRFQRVLRQYLEQEKTPS